MKIIIGVLTAFLAMTLALVWIPYFNKNDTANISANQLYHRQRKFSVNLLHALQKVRPNESLFVSPHSIYRTLLLVYFGSNGETEKSLKKTLQLDWSNSKADVWRAYELEKLGRTSCRDKQSIEFNSVEKLYFSCEVKIKDSVKEMFKDDIKVLNFASHPERARGQINIFVEDATKNMIKNVLPPNSITTYTEAVLINAVYFKGDWVSKFNKQETCRETFYKDNRTPVYVDMMSQWGYFNYGFIKQLNTNFLEMPYQGLNTSISMYIFLPVNDSDSDSPHRKLFFKSQEKAPEISIDQFLEKLTPEILDEVFDEGFQRHKIYVEIPKISFDHGLSLDSTLAHMGIRALSNAEFAEEQSFQFDAFHQAKIEIDESGTVAAATTGMLSLRSGSNLRFICNRPFMFFIHNKISKEILFAGIYRGPK